MDMSDYLYPVPSTAKRLFLRRPRLAEPLSKDETLSIHFYAKGLRGRLVEAGPRKGTYLHCLAEKHGISLTDYPVKPYRSN